MSKLIYLVDEIRAALEIYYSGRTGGQYWRTAFILCDDYTELVSKLFLLTDNPNWSDTRPNDSRFKNYHEIQADVRGVFAAKRPVDLPRVQELHDRVKDRRDRRNDFFHSTHLLDLSVTSRNCVEAFCDLLGYGELLFGASWQREISDCHDFETLGVLLRLEKLSFSDATIWPKVCRILTGPAATKREEP
jgi:hypothetical protein